MCAPVISLKYGILNLYKINVNNTNNINCKKTIIGKNNRKTALFSVIGGGCNGFRYVLEPTQDSKIN